MANRRDFLQTSAAIAAVGATAAGAAQAQPAPQPQPAALPTIRLGQHQVTRLIVGGNPVYGHSHFNRILSRYYTDWHTPERVVALLRRCERSASTPGRTVTPSAP